MSMAATNELLANGIQALKAGRKTQAQKLLHQVVQRDKTNESAWLWLSGAVDTVEEQRVCLQKVLAINPGNQAAKLGLQQLACKRPAPEPMPQAAPRPPEKKRLPAMSLQARAVETEHKPLALPGENKPSPLMFALMIVCIAVSVIAGAILRLALTFPAALH